MKAETLEEIARHAFAAYQSFAFKGVYSDAYRTWDILSDEQKHVWKDLTSNVIDYADYLRRINPLENEYIISG